MTRRAVFHDDFDDSFYNGPTDITALVGGGGGGGGSLPDPSGEPDGKWLRTASGAAIWDDTVAADISIADAGGYFTGTDVEAALQELGAGGGGGGGFQVVDYKEFTSSVSITATTEATANQIVAGDGFTADGTSAYLITFFSPDVRPDSSLSSRTLNLVLYQDGSSLGILQGRQNVTAGALLLEANCSRRLVPSAGTRTYSIRGYVNAGTGVAAAGTGGSGNTVPGYIIVVKLA